MVRVLEMNLNGANLDYLRGFIGFIGFTGFIENDVAVLLLREVLEYRQTPVIQDNKILFAIPV